MPIERERSQSYPNNVQVVLWHITGEKGGKEQTLWWRVEVLYGTVSKYSKSHIKTIWAANSEYDKQRGKANRGKYAPKKGK